MYRLLSDLGVLVDRMPQVFDERARHFQRPALRSAARADEHGRALGRSVAVAQSAVSHLAPIPREGTAGHAIMDPSDAGEGPGIVTAGVNAIIVADQDFLLVEARGRVTHLAGVSDGGDQRAAVNVARVEYPAPPEVIPGYD